MDQKQPTIAMQPVQGSSNVSSLGYDESTSTMAVAFKSGATYFYAGVPQDVFTTFLQADSKGSHFSTHIRGRYEGVKQDPKGAAK